MGLEEDRGHKEGSEGGDTKGSLGEVMLMGGERDLIIDWNM